MADDRTDIPGSGDVQAESGPSDQGLPSPQAATYSAEDRETAEQQGSRGPICLIIGLVGCGCLLIVLLALGIIGGIGWSIFEHERDASPPTDVVPPSEVQIEEPAESTGGELNPAPMPSERQPTEDPGDVGRPGPGAAIAWANNRRSDWEATVNDYSEDWQWVRLVMGPPGSGGTTWVEIEWNTPAGRYGLIDEGPIAAEEPDDGAVPRIFMPSEEVAKEAALGYVEQPDWVARVDSHSDDWRRATVSVGPPASEWVWVVTLQWNDQGSYYDQISIDDVDYPGME